MSWFETTKGFASFAKSAIKEAQKKIDRALDIQEEIANTDSLNSSGSIIVENNKENVAGSGGDDLEPTKRQTTPASLSKRVPGGANREKSKTEPSTPIVSEEAHTAMALKSSLGVAGTALATSTSWDSFTGSFFDNPNTKDMVTVTTAPKAGAAVATTSPTALQAATKRQSVTSNSASVELLSSPTSPDVVSPSDATNSESVELVTDSIVIISNDEACDEDEDSISTSYKTIMNDFLNAAPPPAVATDINQDDAKPLSAAAFVALPHSNSTTSTVKLLMSMEDTMPFETQTMDSDSTQSFEDVQMQSSAFTKDSPSPDADKVDHISTAPQSYSSPPNSNDEMETTTSSDIEIISNPNGGDSSSTNSTTRTSPLKLKKLSDKQAAAVQAYAIAPAKKGHYRDHSEISVLSEDSQSELDKLMQRINELNQMLETREMRLLQSERQNAELHERNIELQTMVDAIKSNTVGLDSADEYTQRVSALEKKFQASIRERDALRIQVKTLKEELDKKIPKDDLTQVVTESNAMISELQKEGEKLSKEILQQSNIIKKLRAKEKTTDALLKKNKDQIAELSEESERLKRTLNAKEEVERTQIEAVHKMSSEKRKLDEENSQQRSKIEDLQMKLSTLQASFDVVKAELKQRTQLHSDLTRTTEEALNAKREKEQLKAENQEIMLHLTELREKMRSSEQVMVKREQQLREDNRQLLQQLEAAELRAESSTQEVSLTTIPLMRQLESLQNTLTQRTVNFNKEEQLLLEKLEISQTRLKHLENVEATYKQKSDLLQQRCKELEEKLSHILLQEEKTQIALQQATLDYNMKETELKRQITMLNDKVDQLENLNKSLEEDLQKQRLESKTSAGGNTNDVQHNDFTRSMTEQQQQLQQTQQSQQQQQQQQQQQPTRCQSPAISFSANSLEEAMGGSIDWQPDDLDCISNSGYPSNLAYGMPINLLAHNTTTLEHLHSLLKQRDGELNHLQWELSRLQAERTLLNDEITNLTLELENAKDKLQTFEALEANFNDLQHRYDAVLQMYGEKVERTEELELDLVELKEAYKTQIDELLAQPQTTTTTKR